MFSSIGSVPSLVVRPNQIDQERTAIISFERGAVSDYPFDSYRVTVDLIALSGTDTSLTKVNRTVLPLEIEGSSVAAGTIVTATTHTRGDGVLSTTLTVRRSLVSRGWALAMMAIYWALAILAASITYMVVRRRRPMETRLLAWLSAMVFALVRASNRGAGGTTRRDLPRLLRLLRIGRHRGCLVGGPDDLLSGRLTGGPLTLNAAAPNAIAPLWEIAPVERP